MKKSILLLLVLVALPVWSQGRKVPVEWELRGEVVARTIHRSDTLEVKRVDLVFDLGGENQLTTCFEGQVDQCLSVNVSDTVGAGGVIIGESWVVLSID